MENELQETVAFEISIKNILKIAERQISKRADGRYLKLKNKNKTVKGEHLIKKCSPFFIFYIKIDYFYR